MDITSVRSTAELRLLALVVFLCAVTMVDSSVAQTENRINDAVLAAYEPVVFESTSGQSLPYRLLRPSQLQPGKMYPLVLFLHGAGERGDDNQTQLVHAAAEFARHDRRQRYPAFVLVPQCPQDSRWVESPWDLPTGAGEFDEQPSVSMALTLELVDSFVETNPVDATRLYVTGLSMGGQGSWYAAAAKPARFAAMLEVCGGGDPTWAARYAGIPIWAFHGQDDHVVPVSRGREMIKALTDAGHHPELRYVEYPQVKHDSWTRTYARDDVYEWLFAQTRKQ